MEEWIATLSRYCVVLTDTAALLCVMVGTVKALGACVHLLTRFKDVHSQRHAWVEFGHWLLAALTFLLAGDIVSTSISPSWEDTGHLAAIAVIRTFLDFFLKRDLDELEPLKGAEASR